MEAEAKPMTNESIVFTEKKMSMSLDDIVKMSKKSKTNNRRESNKSRKSFNTGAAQKSSTKVRQYIDSRSSVRQGALAKKRSNFNGNQFPMTTGVAKKAAVASFSNWTSNGNWTRNNKSYKGTGEAVVKKKCTGGNVSGKWRQQKAAATQKPRTLDERFANLKQQRMRNFGKSDAN
jgi:hypothetical protein